MRRGQAILILGIAWMFIAATTVVNLATQVTGLLATTNGGTGQNSSATFPSSGTVMITTTSVQASQMPALTGDATSSAGAVATTVAKIQSASMTAATALGNTGTLSMDFSTGHIFTTTPSGAITLNATNCATGRWATIIVTTSGTTSYTITPNTNFKGTALSTGSTTAKTYGWSFVCNGTTAYQMSAATAAM